MLCFTIFLQFGNVKIKTAKNLKCHFFFKEKLIAWQYRGLHCDPIGVPMKRILKSLCHPWCLWLSSVSELRCSGWLWDLYSTSIFESSVLQEITAGLCWQLSEVTFSVKSPTEFYFISLS